MKVQREEGIAMRHLKVALIVLGGLGVTAPVPPAMAQATKPSPPTAPATAMVTQVYKPPLLGAPGGRVGGGTRGTGRQQFVLTVLAPDHTGQTVREQPTLYWFISSDSQFPVELTLTDPRTTRPVLETRLAAPVAAGVHSIRLAAYGVRLDPGVPYRWFVSVVADPGRRSRDILAGGAIERIEPAEGVRTQVARARPDELPSVYAEAGLWYDALAAISELIASYPDDRELQKQRAVLLTQAGLPAIGD